MSSNFTRRDVAKVAGSAALGMTAMPVVGRAQPSAETQAKPVQGDATTFPDGFRWGVATSAYQIEGAVKEDGRGTSIWDVYAHTPGKIKDGRNADVANDHYHRYRDDVRMMRDIGVKAYRFSVAWPRIFPDGTGQPNAKGLAFYNRLIDALLEAGIEPFPTLYHWDLPQALQDGGGWQSRDTAKAFADYAGYVAGQFSDRAKNFFTINEFFSFVDIGHRGVETMVDGKKVRIELAPGLRLPDGELNQMRHNAVLAQGLSVQAIRAGAKSGTKCGPADNLSTAVPAIETADNIRAAEIATREMNAPYLTVMLEGKYTDAYLAAAGKDAPKFTEEELKIISSPVDFIGINVYRPTAYVVASEAPGGFRPIPFNKSHPHMLSSWHLLGPEVIYWAPRLRAFAVEDQRTLHHRKRLRGKRRNLRHRHRRRFRPRHVPSQPPRPSAPGGRRGIARQGLLSWSLMDNFEWSEGFANRFGIVYVDFNTQQRIPKLSAAWFGEAIAKNAVV